MNIKNILVNYVRPHELVDNTERRTFLFLFILTFAQIVSFQAWQALYTNYVVEVVELNGAQNGIVQSIRELPGLLAISILLFLKFIKEENMAIVSVFLLGFGVMFTGFFPSYLGMILTTFCMSLGYHYFETINQSITLQSFSTKLAPLVISRVRSISALGSIFAALFILFCSSFLSYTALYFLTGVIGILGAIWAIYRKPDLSGLTTQKTSLVYKRKYWLFYVLTFLSGGRRQIFTIFSLFLLVQKFDYSVAMVTLLFLINNTVNWLLNPLIGKLINILGERILLTVQFVSAIFIFLGYAFLDIGWLVAFLYIVDQFTFSFNIAEKTFFQKIGDPEDISPSMALSFTINHIAAVVIPVVGGLLWEINYQYPFLLGVGIAVFSLFFVQFIDKQLNEARQSV